MRRARLLRSTPFRLAVIFSALFLVAFVVASLVAVQAVRQNLVAKLDRDVGETYAVLAASYGDNDIEDLIGLVQNHVAVARAADQIFLLTGRGGARLVGNIAQRAVPLGWSTAAGSDLGLDGAARYRLLAGDIGSGYRLVVGKSYAEIETVGAITAVTFMWATLVALLVAVAGGWILARRLQRRMDAIAGTMARISEGELGARIPLIGNGDDVDVLSVRINDTLDRLSGLFEGMRQVAADIAHDLKTPLNRLKLTIRAALGKQEAGEPVAAELEEADAESDRINATFDALLRIAQIEAGARKARFAPVRLGDVAAAIAEAYVEVAGESGRTLHFEAGDVSHAISGDRQLLLQMCANLVENAMIHGPAGTRIGLRVAATDAATTLCVTDDGPGIPESERANVLRRLYRLEKSRTTPGSGLGLSLVKAVADLHGARLVLSDNQPGLCVTIEFPNLPPRRTA
ncbi:two-component sensor histidine kinase [Kaistia sp. 32K]|uniref:sensor histidine kinase n=1 Tax=Kaistia sp. 32K TaxID=2795690 RepID=UPI001915DFF2|nr:HAMP domain-containing sensor histidine kinase [Kaistia sp. 32K]BCP54872.1 two-component sensor histidine kinase [Kaistia sp. 32K]